MRGISLWYPSFFVRSHLPLSLSPYPYPPPYIYVPSPTQSCVNIQVIYRMAYLIYRHYLSILSLISYLLSLIYLSILCYLISLISHDLSHLSLPLSPYHLSNIYYIYNKYPIYLSLPYNLYTHDHICSIFIIDYVII